MKRFTAGTVGRGKAIHAVHAFGDNKGQTACGKTAGTLVDGDTATTCKSCRNALPSWTLLVTDEELAEMETEAREQNMAVDAARRAVETAEAITAYQIARAENMDRIVSEDWDAALAEQAQRDAAPAPRELDIWLTEGTVLVDPVTGDLMTFERWGPEGAQLRNQRTGAQHVVGQSNVVTWKYIPRPVEWNQVWREKTTGALVRIVDMVTNSVRLRGMEPEDRPFWLGKDLLAQLYVWAPEKAA